MKNNCIYIAVAIAVFLFVIAFAFNDVYASDDDTTTLTQTKDIYKFDCQKDSTQRVQFGCSIVYPSNERACIYIDEQYGLGVCYYDDSGIYTKLVRDFCYYEPASSINITSDITLILDYCIVDNGNAHVNYEKFNKSWCFSLYDYSFHMFSNRPYFIKNVNVTPQSIDIFDKAYNKKINTIKAPNSSLTNDNLIEALNTVVGYSEEDVSEKFKTYIPKLIDRTYLGNSVVFEYDYSVAKKDGYRPTKLVVDSMYIDYVGAKSNGLKSLQLNPNDVCSTTSSMESFTVNVDLYTMCKILAVLNSDSDYVETHNYFDIKDFIASNGSTELMFDESSTIEAVTIYCHYEYSSFKSEIVGSTQETKTNIYTADNMTLTTNQIEQNKDKTEQIIIVVDKEYKPSDNTVIVYPPDVNVTVNIPDSGNNNNNNNIERPNIGISDTALDFGYFSEAMKSVRDITVTFAEFLGIIWNKIFGSKMAVAVSFAVGGVVIARFLGR